MKRTLSLTLVFATFAFAGMVQSTDVRASTADGSTPSEETACDGATGVNNGICIAYCEATDCGDAAVTTADDNACTSLADMFAYTNTDGDIADCFSDGGGGGGDDTCMSRCKQTAVRQYEACFRERIIIPKDRVQKDASGAYELTTTGIKVHGSLGSGESIDCVEGKIFCEIKGRDCATSVNERLETCAARCL